MAGNTEPEQRPPTLDYARPPIRDEELPLARSTENSAAHLRRVALEVLNLLLALALAVMALVAIWILLGAPVNR